MGGKGKKRREKNYLAAHGGPTRLPPPPDPSQLDALPFKLRKLFSFASSSPHDSAKEVEEKKQKNKKAGVDSATGVKSGCERSEAAVVEERKVEGQKESSDHENGGFQTLLKSGDEKKKKKRKRNQVKDLRFEKELEELEGRSKRRERKKKYWEKKKKNKKGKTEEAVEDFPKHEKIRFGDVVQAPPKLVVVPKAPKSIQSASKERLRLQAVEAYRARKGWTSRLGLQFPSISMQPDGA